MPPESAASVDTVVTWMETLEIWVATYGLSIIGAILILIVGRIVAGLVRKGLRVAMTRSKVDETLVSFVSNLSYVAVMVFVIIAILSKLGIQTASMVAVIGAAGLAVGLALQGSLSNFAAGVLIMLFKPFRVGDFIEGGGATGIVEEINIFTTEMRSPDNKAIIVPNASMTDSNIVNYSTKPTRRVDMVFGVGYGDDLKQVRAVIEEVLAGEERILEEPAPTIAVLELADSSVNFAVRPWVNTPDYWDVFFSLQERMKLRFDEVGISIPFPQRDVHMFPQASGNGDTDELLADAVK